MYRIVIQTLCVCVYLFASLSALDGAERRVLIKDVLDSECELVSRERLLADDMKTRHGLFEEWHPNGLKATEAMYVNGKLDGEQRTWYASGSLCSIENYSRGALHGKMVVFGEMGGAVLSETYAFGKLMSQTFIHDNVEICTLNYRNGKPFDGTKLVYIDDAFELEIYTNGTKQKADLPDDMRRKLIHSSKMTQASRDKLKASLIKPLELEAQDIPVAELLRILKVLTNIDVELMVEDEMEMSQSIVKIDTKEMTAMAVLNEIQRQTKLGWCIVNNEITIVDE